MALSFGETFPIFRIFDEGIGYGQTLFRRVQDVIESGGFHACDLGRHRLARSPIATARQGD